MSRPPTANELKTLQAICRPGGSMKSAAVELGVSHNAIHARLLRVYRKLDVESAAQAVYAVRYKLD